MHRRRGERPGISAWLLSVLLHLALLLPLIWFNAPAPVKTLPPLALELWAGGATPPPPVAVPSPVPNAPGKPAPPPVVTPPPPVAQAATPLLADADIKLKAHKPRPEPEPPKAQPLAPPPPKAEAKPPARPSPKPVPEKAVPEKPAPPVKVDTAKAASKADTAKAANASKAVPSKAAANVKPAARDDLLAELDAPAGSGHGSGVGTAKQTQRGSSVGVAGGSSNGVADAKALYAQTLRNRVRPYVIIPDSVKGNPAVVLEIDILPSLDVRSLRLVRSSGNKQYDDAVQQAVRDMGRFPPLPKGADFTDYRRVTMTFRPKE